MMGTQAGMIQMLRSPVSIVHLPATSNSDFGTVYLDRDGTLWSASKRLFRIHDGLATPVTFPALKGATVRNVLRDRTNTLWLGTNGNGIFKMTAHGVEHYSVRDGLVNNFIRIMTEAEDGSIWIGTDAGVSHMKGKTFRKLTALDGLPNPSIQAIVPDRGGNVWIGTSHGMGRLHGDVIQKAD